MGLFSVGACSSMSLSMTFCHGLNAVVVSNGFVSFAIMGLVFSTC